MRTYILVHGAWQASWCWQRVAQKLTEVGHQVITPDLPGHGKNKPEKFTTLKDYVECISDIIKNQHEEVILVGHSMAGMVISQVAENIPEHIAELIYVTAYVPRDGDSLISMADKLASRNLSPYLVFNRENQEITFKANTPLRELFYGQCEESDAKFAIKQMEEQALEPFVATVHLTNRYNNVKKSAIICTHDQVILQSDQQKMCEGINSVLLDADHAPFLSRSSELVKLLQRS